MSTAIAKGLGFWKGLAVGMLAFVAGTASVPGEETAPVTGVNNSNFGERQEEIQRKHQEKAAKDHEDARAAGRAAGIKEQPLEDIGKEDRESRDAERINRDAEIKKRQEDRAKRREERAKRSSREREKDDPPTVQVNAAPGACGQQIAAASALVSKRMQEQAGSGKSMEVLMAEGNHLMRENVGLECREFLPASSN